MKRLILLGILAVGLVGCTGEGDERATTHTQGSATPEGWSCENKTWGAVDGEFTVSVCTDKIP